MWRACDGVYAALDREYNGEFERYCAHHAAAIYRAFPDERQSFAARAERYANERDHSADYAGDVYARWMGRP
jgi:hypothetical protein